jgi:hypothetical protein
MEPQELTISQINEVAKTTGMNAFQVKVLRRIPGGLQPGIIALFENATAEMVATPEPWLDRMSGGGVYSLLVYHMNEKSRMVGGPIVVHATGEVRAVDPDICNSPGWLGPPTMVYPAKPRQDSSTPYTSFHSGGGGASGGDASQRGLGQGSSTPTPSNGDPLIIERQRLEAQKEEFLRRTRDADESRHKQDLEIMQARHEASLEKLRSELLSAAAAKPAAPSTDMTQVLLEIAKMSQHGNEVLVQMMKESSSEMRSMMDKSSSEMRTLIMEISKKPAIDPLMERLLEQKENSAEANMKIMAGYAEAVGASVQMAVGALHAVQEVLQPQDQEPHWLKAMKVILKGMSGLTITPQMTVAPAPPQPRQLSRPNGAARPRPAPVQAAPVQAAPPPAPPAQASQPSFAGLDPNVATDVAPNPPSVFLQIVKAIQEKRDPVEIARVFLENTEEPSVKAALDAAGGNIMMAFAGPLKDFLMDPVHMEENQKFIAEQLLPEVQRQGGERVRLEAPPAGLAGGAAGAGEEEAEEEEEEAELPEL